MASGQMFANSTAPTVRMNITQGGSALTLTDYKVKFLMTYNTTLSTAMTTDTVATIALPVASWSVVESGDTICVDDERMQVTAALTAIPTTTAEYPVTRGYTIPAVAATVYASTIVAGSGTNIYVLGGQATFSLAVDDVAAQSVVVTETTTATNYLIAHLVTDVQTAVDSVCTVSTATVSNVGNRLYIYSDTTGTASHLAISSPDDTISTDELGLIAVSDYGESSVATTARHHAASVNAYVIKIEKDARIQSASGGVAEYEWATGDTDKVGTFHVYFEFLDTNGKHFQLPLSGDYTLEILKDPNCRNILEGE